MEEEIENSNDKWKLKQFIQQCYLIVWSIEKNIEIKNAEVVRLKTEE